VFWCLVEICPPLRRACSLVGCDTSLQSPFFVWKRHRQDQRAGIKRMAVPSPSGGQISTKHQNTLRCFVFATCRLPQYPEFWRCYRPRHTWLSWVLEVLGGAIDPGTLICWQWKHPTPNCYLYLAKCRCSLKHLFFWGIYVFHMRHLVWLLAVAPYGQTLRRRTHGQPKQETWELPRPP